MNLKSVKLASGETTLYFDSSFAFVKEIVNIKNCVFIVDETVYLLNTAKFKYVKTIIIKGGEAAKVQSTIDNIILKLIEFEADRKAVLIGVGGGVITDITGYTASIYLRGVAFGYMPTTILGMVDASIGGKNGIDVGVYKNIIGVIRQPKFILYDYQFLKTLPEVEWINGFAEIIKHACIRDAELFKELEKRTISYYINNKAPLKELINRNALIKLKVVKADEFEKGERKLLNYGHTLGHAFENHHKLMHGQAVAIGMYYAGLFSKELVQFSDAERVETILKNYLLPTKIKFDVDTTLDILKMDKKRVRTKVSFILLEKLGKAVIHEIELKQLKKLLENITN